MSRAAPASRGGFALAAVLLLLIGLTALAHGALALAERDRVASALENRLLAARLLARASARALDSHDTLPRLGPTATVLATGARGPLRWTTEGAALDRELVLLVGVGRVGGTARAARSGLIAWALDPSARVAAAPAVVEVGGDADVAGGEVANAGWLEPPDPRWAAVCASELAALDSLDAEVPAALAPLDEPPADAPGVLPSLGLLPGDTILARISDRVVGEVTPGPVVQLSACVDGSSRWGSLDDPEGPCGGVMAIVAAAGDLTVAGGEGQGVLVVTGSVVLTAGARFAGLILAGGDLTLERGAQLLGAARVRGGLRVSDARIRGSACAVARALRASVPLRIPYPIPDAAPVQPL